MKEVSIVGLDLAKRVFQVHAARTDGSVVSRRKLSRAQVLAFFTKLPKCIVAMEACATAHCWARKPRMLVAIALANKMARSIWAMMTKNESYRDPGLAAA